MRAEYRFYGLGAESLASISGKQVTMRLGTDVIAYFKALAGNRYALQNLINL